MKYNCLYNLEKLKPEETYDRLPNRHNILAQNGKDISHMHLDDIANLFEDKSYSITLSLGPPIGKYIKSISAIRRFSVSRFKYVDPIC